MTFKYDIDRYKHLAISKKIA